MILGIDIGGTKTLLGKFDSSGKLLENQRFETPKTYEKFIDVLHTTIASTVKQDKIDSCAVAVPGIIDRKTSVVKAYGNLPWHDNPIVDDLTKILSCPVYIENDAKAAGLGEAVALGKNFGRVLYVTISTGIGIGLTVDGVIDHGISDSGGATMIFEHNGSRLPWEHFASGKAIFTEFGKKASEINDRKIWEEIVDRWIVGFIELIDLTSPDIIVIGGGVGTHFDKYGSILKRELMKYSSPLISIPPIIAANRPEEAVLYGCYEICKQN